MSINNTTIIETMDSLSEPPMAIRESCCLTCEFMVVGMTAKARSVIMGAYDPEIQIAYAITDKCTCTWKEIKPYYICGSYKERA